MTTKLSTSKIIGGYLISALMLVLLFTQVSFGKRTVKRILIDPKGITINNQFFQWNSIAQTAILTEGSKYKSIYLVLGFSDLSSYECYEINEFANASFGRFSRQLSTYIEYFKPKTMHNNRSI